MAITSLETASRKKKKMTMMMTMMTLTMNRVARSVGAQRCCLFSQRFLARKQKVCVSKIGTVGIFSMKTKVVSLVKESLSIVS
jgi:hypothetical protein